MDDDNINNGLINSTNALKSSLNEIMVSSGLLKY